MSKVTALKNPAGKAIYCYYTESAQLLSVMRALLESFVQNDTILKLSSEVKEHNDLTALLKEAVAAVWPMPHITYAVTEEHLRLILYYLLYGYTVQGKDAEGDFPRPISYNKDFNMTMQGILENLIDGIIESKNESANTSNPAALAKDLTKIRSMILDRVNNLVPAIADKWYLVFHDKLEPLLDNPTLIRILNVGNNTAANSEDRSLRLKRISEKVISASAVPAEAASYFTLAERMGIFIDKIIDTKDWNSTESAKLYGEEDLKVLIHAWGRVTGNDLFARALALRNRAIS